MFHSLCARGICPQRAASRLFVSAQLPLTISFADHTWNPFRTTAPAVTITSFRLGEFRQKIRNIICRGLRFP